MKTAILQIIAKNSDGYIVLFSTSYGTGQGVWKEGKPSLQEDYDVEFSVEEQLIWGDTINEATDIQFIIYGNIDGLTFGGRLEAIEETGLVFLRIGESIIMIETFGTPASVGAFVQAKAKKIFLYDTHM